MTLLKALRLLVTHTELFYQPSGETQRRPEAYLEDIAHPRRYLQGARGSQEGY